MRCLLALGLLAAGCAHSPTPARPNHSSQSDTPTGPRLALGGAQSCALDADDELTCWGRFAEDAPDGRFHAVGIGHTQACAASVDGGAECWGEDTDTLSAAPDGQLRLLAVGQDFACAVVADGTLGCWGINGTHQAEPPLGRYVAIGAGRAHACALGEDGGIKCWGDNQHQQGVPPSGHFIALGVGDNGACGVREGGALHCWGKGVSRGMPAGDYVDVVAGAAHACAQSTDSSLRCWGSDTDGQATAPKGRFYTLGSGEVHACGIRYPTGKLSCWGNDYNSEGSPPSGVAKLELPEGTTMRGAARQATDRGDDGAPSVSFGKVIVLGLHSADGDDEDARALSFGLREASTRVPGYAVGDEAMSSGQLDLAHGCGGMDARCVKKIAKGLDAAAVVYGTMRRDKGAPDKRRIVELHIYEALSGKISGSTKQVLSLSQLQRPALLERSEQILRALHDSSR